MKNYSHGYVDQSLVLFILRLQLQKTKVQDIYIGNKSRLNICGFYSCTSSVKILYKFFDLIFV